MLLDSTRIPPGTVSPPPLMYSWSVRTSVLARKLALATLENFDLVSLFFFLLYLFFFAINIYFLNLSIYIYIYIHVCSEYDFEYTIIIIMFFHLYFFLKISLIIVIFAYEILFFLWYILNKMEPSHLLSFIIRKFFLTFSKVFALRERMELRSNISFRSILNRI